MIMLRGVMLTYIEFDVGIFDFLYFYDLFIIKKSCFISLQVNCDNFCMRRNLISRYFG